MKVEEVMLMNHAALVAATVAAAQHGLLQALVDGDNSAAGYAEALGLDLRATERVLEVLASEGFAVRNDACVYRASEAFRVAGGIFPIAMQYAVWQHAPAFLKTGEPGELARAGRSKVYAMVTPALGRIAAAPAKALRDALAGESFETILDVGAGAGVWSLTMAEQTDRARVTAMDFPEVLAVFEGEAQQRGMGGRVDVIAGDYHAADVPISRYDRLIIANVLRLETEDDAARLLARWAKALKPRGLLVVVDAISDGSAEGERNRAAYSMHLALRNAVGFPHREPTIREWMARAGLQPDKRIDLGGSAALAAIVARAA
jgi:ubiquinone/menaquinone biosynthesis C-methylase UbiE